MPDKNDISRKLLNPLNKLWEKIFRKKIKETDVYFISGMCYNCTVFDNLKLPDGFNKKYIEWMIPEPEETLEKYTRKMMAGIDTSRPFILVGYSFGGVIVQEMNKYLNPIKTIIISSFKRVEEIPGMFKVVSRANLWEKIPERLYNSTEFITEIFNRFIYNVPNSELISYMTITDPVYVRWAVNQITTWKPPYEVPRLYHIHGTDDQIFPFTLIHNAFPVQGGDHLMVFKKADVVSLILGSILLINEKD